MNIMAEHHEISKDFLERVDRIAEDLKKLNKDYPMSEYNLFITKYKDSGEYEWGRFNHKIQHENNLDAYQDQLIGLKYRMIESRRFCDVLHLEVFRVTCLNDEM